MVAYRVFTAFLFVFIVSTVSSAPGGNDQKPFDCPAGEKYYKCNLEVCFKTCSHLINPPPCPALAPGCYMPGCECENDYLRDSNGKCVSIKECNKQNAEK